MGYLVDTSPTLTYEQSKSVLTYIRQHGILQFLHLYKKFKDFSQSETYWGDEVELHLLNIDPQTNQVKLQLNTDYLFSQITPDAGFQLHEEYGAWMLEAVPSRPYESNGDPNPIFESLKARREKISALCKEGDFVFAGSGYPRFKVGDFFIPKYRDDSPIKDNSTTTVTADQIYNDLLSPHPRYPTMCENVRQRRGENVSILVPLYQDEKTNMTEKTDEEPYPGFIYMDDTLSGTGNSSMQVTFGTKDLDEARYLTDQMNVFSSIMMPLSAASCIFKGKLSDHDVRWSVLCQSSDCRTQEERDPNHKSYIPKSRWGPISRYISNRPQCKDEYNDVYFPLDKEMMDYAQNEARKLDFELDDRLLGHLGFLFSQDPLVVFASRIFVDDTKNTNHFENIQSTNWNNVRFKPPPSFDSEVGWRVELRSMECQLTPEEGTALGMFSYFVATMIKKKEYNFYIPISKFDENMTRGQKRDAILTEKFWFRKDIKKDSADEYVELTIDEMLHGKEGVFVGLFNLIYEFCKEEYGVDMQAEWARKKQDDSVEVSKIVKNMRFFEILSKRAKGETPTIARWMRNFVGKHKDYQKDSVVSAEIVADLIKAMTEISDGKKTYSDF